MKCKSLQALKNELNKKITNALKEEVNNIVIDAMIEHINEDVYNVYEPKFYQRRYTNDGLADISNIDSDVKHCVLAVQNNAIANPVIYIAGKELKSQNQGNFLTPIIETGNGYDFSSTTSGGREYLKPRPFVSNTNEDLKNNKQHITALKKGLKRQGVRCE